MNNVIERGHSVPDKQRELWLAGGCFWGTEAYFSEVAGVTATDVGYANGHTPSPTYEAVCTRTTGYAETVRVVYDPARVSLRFLLELYFESVNPTSVNRQGGDIGDQYRTGIYYTDKGDLSTITAALNALQQRLDQPVAIEVAQLKNYYLAEAYHQQYLRKNPGGYCHISPSKMNFARDAREYHKPDDKILKETLTPLQYEVTQRGATERPFQNEYHDHFARGIYVDVATGQPLFRSSDKFESGCGWPAFSRPIHPENLIELVDTSHGMLRTEVKSKLGDNHLGHVFEDGPAELGGLRYCINSAALRFVPQERMEQEGYGYLLRLLDSD